MKIKRRDFFHKSSTIAIGVSTFGLPNLSLSKSSPDRYKEKNAKFIDERTYLSRILYTKEEVDDWFAGKAFPFSKHDPELGWLLPNAQFQDGINDSISTYTYAENDGERIMSNYHEKECRINTYGNSFTQCHQVG